MISVSESWKNAHKGELLPESFLEISVGFADPEARDLVTATSSNNAVFSNLQNVVGDIDTPSPAYYATLEHNLWILDGSRNIMPDAGSYQSPGYVSADDTEGNILLTLPEIRNHTIPGFVITWSSEYGEYPTAFTVEARNGEAVVAAFSVTDNASNVTEVPLEISGYDRVEINIQEWNYPDHRARIDRVYFGHVFVFGKNDIISYTHEQYGNILSGELPKASISFSLDNVDGKWSPMNPTGLGKYISERQMVTVRYGLYVDNAIEWINAGSFYLTEWRTPSNGLAAYFEARDIFEFMLNEEYTGIASGTAEEIIQSALSVSGLPTSFSAILDPALGNVTVTMPDERTKVAEVIQMCANKACCVIYQDRNGVLRIEPLKTVLADYVISSFLSYAHPEMELSKPLKNVSVSYGNQKFVLDVASSGETQTVSNPLVTTAAEAENIAIWVRDMLKQRAVVTGEFRGDPCLDLYDIVSVNSKYGVLTPVVITNIKYSYSGAFRASYTGRVIDVDVSVLDEFILDEDVLS
jgi:hypothetical protein